MLSHTADWLRRKYEQAVEEKYNASRERSVEGFNGLRLLVDSMFNQGKGFNEILPKFEELNKKEVKAKKDNFVGGTWWKSE